MRISAGTTPTVTFERAAVPQSDHGKRIKQRDYLPQGRIPVIDQGQSHIGGYTNDDDFAFDGELPVVLFGDHTRTVKLVAHRFAVGADGIKIFRPADGVQPKYLYYWMKSARIPDRRYGRHYQFLRQLSLPLPEPTRQDEIVAEIEKQFSRLDEAAASLVRAKASLRRYGSAVLRAAVQGRLVPTEAEVARRECRSYESGEQLLRRVLEIRQLQVKRRRKSADQAAPLDENNLPKLPEGWAWTSLGAIAALKGGITVDQKRKDSTARSVPYLRVANVQRGYLDLSEVKTIEAPATDIEDLRLLPGDVLFNEGGDRDKLGRGWIWEGQLKDCIHQNHVFRARLFCDAVSSKLLSWWGNTFGKNYFIREGKQTTNLASINLTKLSALPIPLPPSTEQFRIVAEVERHLTLLHGVEVEVNTGLMRAERLRSAVLGAAFTEGVERV